MKPDLSNLPEVQLKVTPLKQSVKHERESGGEDEQVRFFEVQLVTTVTRTRLGLGLD